MRYKKIVISILIVLLLGLMVGCSSKQTESKTDAPPQRNQDLKMPAGNPALIGKVKEIIGNEVTVFKVQFAQDTNNSSPENEQNRRPGSTFSDETESFIIPVGTPIVILQRGTNEVTTIELTEIKKDQMLRIWKNADTVEFVQLMGGGMRAGNGEGQRGGLQGGGQGMGMGGGPR